MHWANTFGYVLLPGGVAGALLALSPLTFTAILIVHIGELPSLAQDGIGGGAIGAPVVGIVEGYALSRRGSRVGRCLAAAACLAPGAGKLTGSGTGPADGRREHGATRRSLVAARHDADALR